MFFGPLRTPLHDPTLFKAPIVSKYDSRLWALNDSPSVITLSSSSSSSSSICDWSGGRAGLRGEHSYCVLSHAVDKYAAWDWLHTQVLDFGSRRTIRARNRIQHPVIHPTLSH